MKIWRGNSPGYQSVGPDIFDYLVKATVTQYHSYYWAQGPVTLLCAIGHFLEVTLDISIPHGDP